MSGYTLDNLQITETFYGWYNKTNEVIDLLNSVVGDGVSGATQEDGRLIIELIDGTTLDAGYVVGPTGPYVNGAAINGDGELVLTLTNNTTFNVGNVIGPTGETGATGAKGDIGSTGETGPTGEGVPPGGNIGFALVKSTNDDYDTQWADVSSVARSHPGKIGGYEGATGSFIFGRGQTQDGRFLFPRWSTNYYLSQVHKGPGISMAGATGIYPVAGLMEGYTSGYDDGLTAGIKILNFLENTLPFEGNVYTDAGSSCLGQTLDSPPGYYWNRMKYFPTAKLQPFYVGSYCYVDKYVGYIAGYENNVSDSARRGMYVWFGIIPANSFPTGTPQSEVFAYDGFVRGSTCAYFFRDEGAGLCSNGFAISETNTNYGVDGYTYSAWTGDYVREVIPGRTGPIAFYPEASGPFGLGDGFVLSPGWYYMMTEMIPTAWFSVGSELDDVDDEDAYGKGISGDQVIFTHTDARNHYGDMSLFGLNGFELAPAGEDTGVGEVFTPSSYLTISSVRSGLKTIPTGLAPYLWFTVGITNDGDGRFGGSADTGYYLKDHIGLHQIDDNVSDFGAMAIRAQNPEQASAPRFGISIKSSASQFDSLRTIDIGTNPPSESNFCTYTWDGLSPWGGVAEPVPGDGCPDCWGGTADERPFDWHRLLFGDGDIVQTSAGLDTLTDTWSSINGSVTYRIQLTCESGQCPTFAAPPGFPINNEISKDPIPVGPVSYYGIERQNRQADWSSIGGTTQSYGEEDALVDPDGNLVLIPINSGEDIEEFGFTKTYGDKTFEFDSSDAITNPQYGYYLPSGGANHGSVEGYDCDSHYPGTIMNPYGLTTAGATANPDEGWIMIFDDAGNTYFFGFYNGETGAEGSGIVDGVPVGATNGCSPTFRDHTGNHDWDSNDIDACFNGEVIALPPGTNLDPIDFVGSGSLSSISTYVNAQEAIHKEWFGEFPGTEKNHLIKYTAIYGCTSGTSYPEYQGP